ncbi:hypothetical protein DXG01_000338 [Tephrocybe rancida]|nr:hypothetical protein DXG01_000338 [Tephrocybe rancida]
MESRLVAALHVGAPIYSSDIEKFLIAGGSLTAWGVTKTRDRFKAAVVGAGRSNWGELTMKSGSPELEAILILHGEKDEQVPVGQAIELWQGLKRKASESARNAVQLVLYPREPHG